MTLFSMLDLCTGWHKINDIPHLPWKIYRKLRKKKWNMYGCIRYLGTWTFVCLVYSAGNHTSWADSGCQDSRSTDSGVGSYQPIRGWGILLWQRILLISLALLTIEEVERGFSDTKRVQEACDSWFEERPKSEADVLVLTVHSSSSSSSSSSL